MLTDIIKQMAETQSIFRFPYDSSEYESAEYDVIYVIPSQHLMIFVDYNNKKFSIETCFSDTPEKDFFEELVFSDGQSFSISLDANSEIFTNKYKTEISSSFIEKCKKYYAHMIIYDDDQKKTVEQEIIDELMTIKNIKTIYEKYHQSIQLAFKMMKVEKYDIAIQQYIFCFHQGYKTPDVSYNIACCYALQNDFMRALDWLKETKKHIPNILTICKKDPDFAKVKQHIEIIDLLNNNPEFLTFDQDKIKDFVNEK